MVLLVQPPAPPIAATFAVVADSKLGHVGRMPQQVTGHGLAYLALKQLASQSTTYTVQPGDCLWSIAAKFYGNGAQFMRIFDANTKIIRSPGLIKSGQHLVIPHPSPGAPIPAPAAPASPAPVGQAAATAPGTPVPGVPWSIFNQPNGQRLAVWFAGALLKTIGAPDTPGNRQVIYDWEVSEGSGGWYNPLNGGDFGNLAVSGTQYGGGASNYPKLGINVTAMAGILLHDQGFGYDAIVSALRANDPGSARQAIWASDWAASHYNGGASFSDAPLPF